MEGVHTGQIWDYMNIKIMVKNKKPWVNIDVISKQIIQQFEQCMSFLLV